MNARASALIALSVIFAGCKPGATADGGSLPTAVTVHYHRALSDYGGWTVASTAGAKAPSVASSSTDGFGAIFTVDFDPAATALTFSLSKDQTSDAAGALTVDLQAGVREVWIISGFSTALTQPLPALPGPDQAALYYLRADQAYSGFGLHLWGDQVTQTTWTSALAPVGADPVLGSGFVVPLKTGSPAASCPVGQICLIMHNGDTKDPGPDMSWDRAVLGDLVFLTSGSSQLTSVPRKAGAISVAGAAAHLLARDTVSWNVTHPKATAFELRGSTAADLKVTDTDITGGTVVALTPRTVGLSPTLAGKVPLLAAWRAFDVPAEALDTLKALLTGQLVAIARDSAGAVVEATAVQTPFILDELFFTTEVLGPTFATVAGAPTVHLWAPTAQSVKLRLYDAAKAELPESPVTMTANDKRVWSATGPATWYGKYYRFELTVFHPVTGQIETVLVTDPYATSLSTNSRYAQLIDLADPALAPAGWATFTKPPLAGPEDVVIDEGHVRDFSAFDNTVSAEHRGRYLGFADAGSDGMKHLAALASAGMTHLHLLPIFDFATVDEDASKRLDLDAQFSALCAKAPALTPAQCTQFAGKTVREALAALPGDSKDQQAIATAMGALDGFNWGYDPLHFGVPEGSYASSPEGTARIVELRAMVQGLSAAGLRVVMDVVYNHTNASGIGDNAVLDKVVPGYYHRRDEKTGLVASSTCCANTASEHRMMERLMIDTLVRWARDYKIDGFRFDLMGHHMKSNLLAVQTALTALTVAADGVDGTKLLLYGEGWDFGEVATNARGVNGTQINMAGTGIGTFNDRMRDGVRGGSAFDSAAAIRKAQGFASGLFLDPNELTDAGTAAAEQLDKSTDWIKIGMAGSLARFRLLSSGGENLPANAYGYNGARAGYTGAPLESINYCSAHDNQTLWDISQYKLPFGTPLLERERAHLVALATVALGQGTPFFHLGDDLLRSKSMERDSYNSGDWFNRIDWTAQTSAWKSGLPSFEKDSANWPLVTAAFGDLSAAPTPEAIGAARDRFRELLRIRKSSRLFRLGTEAAVMKRVDFPNGGPTQIRGLLAVAITDGVCAGADLDPAREALVVLINAGKTEVNWTLTGASGFTLHPVDQASADLRARTSTFVGETFTVPARTVAVFEKLQAGVQGNGLPCNTR